MRPLGGGHHAVGLRVDDVHRKGLVAIQIARQGDEHPVAIALGLHGLAIDGATPEFGRRRELKALKLFFIVLHHEGSLGEHLAIRRKYRGDLRAVGHGIQHAQFFKTFCFEGQRIIAAGILPRERHRPGGHGAVGGGQFGFIHAMQRVASRLHIQLQTRCGGDGNGAGLALHRLRVNAADRQFRALGIKGVIIRHHQGVAAPGFVLQPDGPHLAGLFFAADVGSREIDVPAMRRHPDLKFLHALVRQAVANRRAAAHAAIANRHEVEHVCHHPGIEAGGADGQ